MMGKRKTDLHEKQIRENTGNLFLMVELMQRKKNWRKITEENKHEGSENTCSNTLVNNTMKKHVT